MKRDFSKDYHRNNMILDSIPIRHDIVRYFTTKFRIICSTRGYKAGSDAFKSVRELILEYIASDTRIADRQKFYSRYPFRKNGWMRALFDNADTQPHAVLDMLKMYTSFKQPLVTVEESARDQHAYLESRKPSPVGLFSIEDMINRWLDDYKASVRYRAERLASPKRRRRRLIRGHHPMPSSALADLWSAPHYSQNHVYDYWREFDSLFRFQSVPEDILEPDPLMYKDLLGIKGSSQTFQEDYDGFAFTLQEIFDFEDPMKQENAQELNRIVRKRTVPQLPESFMNTHGGSWNFSCVAGRIHHIPKKGTVKRRPIAVPNRFYQAGLLPLQRDLYKRLEVLPRDCTFNQSRFINEIKYRVDKGHFVQGVDLSQATDNLPFKWFQAIFDRLTTSDHVKDSYKQFCCLLNWPWENDVYDSFWTKGQPLGTLPSFGILAITHNILLEALAYHCGRLDHPYVVLGDDILIFDETVAESYITLMEYNGIPLSLHKSYKGRMVEFAGRIFIRNQHPWYSSDHSTITMSSLFDYQSATGIRIPFANLPSAIRRRLGRLTLSPRLAEQAYTLVSYAVTGRDLPQNSSFERDLVNFFSVLYKYEEEESTNDIESTGFYTLDDNDRTFVFHRESPRVTTTSQNLWFKQKVRPYTTEQLMFVALRSISSN